MNPVSNIPVINSDFYKVAYNGRILPYYKESIFASFGKNYFASFIDMWADTEAVCDQEIWHVEENEQVWTFKPSANVSGAPGAATDITVSSAYHYLGGKYTHVQPGYILAFPPIGKLGKVTAVDITTDNAHVVTVVPFDPAYSIVVTTAQDVIVIPVNMRKVGDCQENNSTAVVPGLAYSSQLMIAGKDLKIAGSDLAKWCDKIQFVKARSPLDPCKEVDVLWHVELEQMMLEFVQGWAMLFLLGEAVNNPSGLLTDYKGTIGYLPTIRSRGSMQTYTAATGVALTDIDTITDRIKSRRGYCTEYGWWAGKSQRRNLDNILGEYFDAGAISYGAFNCEKGKCVDFGFQAFIKNGIEFYLHEEASFNDPGFLGAAGFNGAHTGIMMPLCKMQCGGQLRTPIVINYLANPKAGYSREMEQWDHGVLKPESNNSTCDYHSWHLRSEKGFEMYAPEHQWLIEGL